jgi:hypothetical protein
MKLRNTLRSIALRSIALRSIALRSIALFAIALIGPLNVLTAVNECRAQGACCPGDSFGEGCRSDCDFGPGTLFQWSGSDAVGGPNLNEPLVTDRPDFTEATSTVGRGVTQFELGYTYSYDREGATRSRGHSYPETLMRHGILRDWLELRVAWNYQEVTDFAGGDFKGADDLYLGFKIALTPQDCMLPEMALIPQMTVPTGSAAFNNHRVLPGVNWVYGWELSDSLSTAGSSQFNQALDGTSGDEYVEFAQSWTVAAGLTDEWGCYVEWYGLFPSGADSELPQNYLNGGFTYLISNDLQLDVRAGYGLNSNADDLFLGTGLSARF